MNTIYCSNTSNITIANIVYCSSLSSITIMKTNYLSNDKTITAEGKLYSNTTWICLDMQLVYAWGKTEFGLISLPAPGVAKRLSVPEIINNTL